MSNSIKCQNTFSGCIHLLCCVGLIIFECMQKWVTDTHTGFPVLWESTYIVDCKNFSHEAMAWCNNKTELVKNVREYCTYNLLVSFYVINQYVMVKMGWFLALIFLVAALGQIYFCTLYWKNYIQIVNADERMIARWVQIAISESMLFIVIMFFCGITNVVSLVFIWKIMFTIALIPSLCRNVKMLLCGLFSHFTLWVYIIINVAIYNTPDVIPYAIYILIVSECFLFHCYPSVYYLNGIEQLSTNTSESIYNVLSILSKVILCVTIAFK